MENPSNTLIIQTPKGKGAWSIVHATNRQNIWEGSVRSSKTVNSLIKFAHWVKNESPAGGEILFSGKTRDTIKRNVLNVLQQYVGRKNLKYSVVGGSGTLYGKSFAIVGANDESSEQRIRGMTLAGAYLDEMSILPESFYRMTLSRLSLEGARLYGTTNPDNPKHWLKLEMDKKLPHMSVFHFTLADNSYISEEFKSTLKLDYSGMWYKRFILGLWVAGTGAIYDMFDENVQVVDNTPEIGKLYVGIDYGTNNPTSFLLIAVNNGVATCLDEYYYDSTKHSKQKVDSEQLADFKKFIGNRKIQTIYIDPSASNFKLLLIREGYSCRDADNAVVPGIRTVSNLLSTRKYYINRKCIEHIKEFYSYVWDEKSIEMGVDKPVKQNDHTMDACRYALHTLFGKGGVRVLPSIY